MVCKIITAAAFVLGSVNVNAQLFGQKKAQKKYLEQQIAAFQVYLGYLKTGYEIANKGLTIIQDLKNGEFGLHSDYFAGLQNVNPKIRAYARVSDILVLQNAIIAKAAKIKLVDLSPLLSSVDSDISELTVFISNGKLQLTDKQRLENIDRLYESMLAKFSFINRL